MQDQVSAAVASVMVTPTRAVAAADSSQADAPSALTKSAWPQSLLPVRASDSGQFGVSTPPNGSAFDCLPDEILQTIIILSIRTDQPGESAAERLVRLRLVCNRFCDLIDLFMRRRFKSGLPLEAVAYTTNTSSEKLIVLSNSQCPFGTPLRKNNGYIFLVGGALQLRADALRLDLYPTDPILISHGGYGFRSRRTSLHFDRLDASAPLEDHSLFLCEASASAALQSMARESDAVEGRKLTGSVLPADDRAHAANDSTAGPIGGLARVRQAASLLSRPLVDFRVDALELSSVTDYLPFFSALSRTGDKLPLCLFMRLIVFEGYRTLCNALVAAIGHRFASETHCMWIEAFNKCASRDGMHFMLRALRRCTDYFEPTLRQSLTAVDSELRALAPECSHSAELDVVFTMDARPRGWYTRQLCLHVLCLLLSGDLRVGADIGEQLRSIVNDQICFYTEERTMAVQRCCERIHRRRQLEDQLRVINISLIGRLSNDKLFRSYVEGTTTMSVRGVKAALIEKLHETALPAQYGTIC